MSTNLQTQASNDTSPSNGGVWYELHSEREQICEGLLRVSSASDAQLQERLRLIDDALDRLMAGTYGDCVICAKWIEDNKLHADPALAFCCGCQRRSAAKNSHQSTEVRTIIGQACYQ